MTNGTIHDNTWHSTDIETYKLDQPMGPFSENWVGGVDRQTHEQTDNSTIDLTILGFDSAKNVFCKI